MSLEVIYQKLTEILRDVFDDDSLVADRGLAANQVADWDSFAHLRLMFAIEQSFSVRFAASEISSLKNIGELAELIDRKVAKQLR